MSITAVVNNYIAFSGDIQNESILSSGDLINSPSGQDLITLSAGDNEVEVPSVENFVVHGVAIVPPELNTIEFTLKGINADTGITLSANQATVLQFGATPPASFVLNVSEELVGVRLIWF